MAIHKPWDRPFYLLGGSVMKSGHSLNLSEGQFGVFNVSKQTSKGAVAASTFKGVDKDTLFELRLGNKQHLTRTTSNKMYSSFPFHISDIVDITVSTPKRSKIEVDDLVIGYDGIDPKTSLSLLPGEHREINIELEGKALEYLGVPEGIANIIVPLYNPIEDVMCGPDIEACTPVNMVPIISQAVEYLRSYEFRGGVKLTDYVDVSPVIKATNIVKGGDLTQEVYQLNVVDTGDASALALVQQQYPDFTVSRVERNGLLSTYQVVVREGVDVAPVAYKQTIGSIIKGCEDCPATYEELEGGFVYSVLVEDDGEDLSADITTAFTTIVAASLVKVEGQAFGVGMYTFVSTAKITDAAMEDFVEDAPTAIVKLVGETKSLCSPTSAGSTIAWVKTGECTFDTRAWKIVLADSECGNSRLPELQAAYPELTITETGVTGGCQRQYATSTFTNVVCDECDPMFVDIFSAEAPNPFENVSWESADVPYDGTGALVGIRLRAKVFKLSSGEALRGKIGYIEDSLRIKATGGYITDFQYSTNFAEGGVMKDKPFHTYYLSTYKPRTHVFGNALDSEIRSKTYFTGQLFNHNYMGRILTGNESNLINLDSQYVDYAITIRRNIYSQGLSQRLEENITYHIRPEVGFHQDVEDVLNNLAAARGLMGIQAFPKDLN